jgi:hypothetical protein
MPSHTLFRCSLSAALLMAAAAQLKADPLSKKTDVDF